MEATVVATPLSSVAIEEPTVIHAIPGRVRLGLPGWSGQGQRDIESRLRSIQGVRRVTANPLTGSVLVQFDPGSTEQETILAEARMLDLPRGQMTTVPDVRARPVQLERRGPTKRARIAVRGLDRSPA